MTENLTEPINSRVTSTMMDGIRRRATSLGLRIADIVRGDIAKANEAYDRPRYVLYPDQVLHESTAQYTATTPEPAG